jgi:hypothetical protein
MTSTELVMRDDVTSDGTNDLIVWATAARQAHAIAVSLAGTAFVPKSMQNRPDDVCGAILAGRELGMAPMSALRSIDIIDGTPAMRANALRGLVQRHGHQIWVEESTEHRAIVCGRRRSSPLMGGPTPIERSLWTMDRARKAGLAGKKNWLAHPTSMLVARATAEVCRLIAADVLLGMPYCAEELGDGPPDDAAPAAPAETKPRARRTIQRAPVAPADDPLDHPDEPVSVADDTREPVDGPPEPQRPDDATDAEDPKLTDRQSTRLHVAFRAAGLAERADRLAYASAIVGRDLVSSKDLTVPEAAAVLAALEAAADERDGWPEVRGAPGDDAGGGGPGARADHH